MIPTNEELKELAATVRQLEDQRDMAWNTRSNSPSAYLDYEVASYRYRLASDNLSKRIREMIEAGHSDVVRP